MPTSSQMFRVSPRELLRGALSALAVGFVVALGGVVQQPDFSLFNADWLPILDTALKAGLGAFFGYIGTTFFSNPEGKVLGKI